MSADSFEQVLFVLNGCMVIITGCNAQRREIHKPVHTEMVYVFKFMVSVSIPVKSSDPRLQCWQCAETHVGSCV